MPRLRPKPKTITGHIDGRKYSSLWFAVKAVHSSKLLANNSSQLNHNYLSFNGFMDNKAEDGLKNLSLNHMDSSDDNCDQQMATNQRNVSKDSGVKVVEVNDKMALVLVANEDLEYELGCGCVRFTLLSHNFDVHMNGFTLTTDKSVEMMAVFGHKVTIKCQNNGHNAQTINDLMTKVETLGAKDSEAVMSQLKDNLCVILVEKLCLSSLLYLETVDNFKPLSMKSESTWFDMRSVGTNGFESIKVWDKLFDDLQFGANDVIVVTGGTNVGKSSLIRHLINRYLNKRDTECMYLDCDPGQSEFSTSAQLGLTRIQSPVLCSTAMNVIKHKPLMACSVGATTPSKAANLYISSVYNLVNFYQKDLQSKGPLFVNTMGWTRDLGLALLTDTIKIALPTHVIQMNSTADQSVNIGFDLTPESVKRFNGYRYSGSDRTRSLKYKLSIIESNNKRSKKSQTTRDLQQLSYMSQMPDIAFKPFFAMTPYK
ncbi:unnamed protein product [Oppiella nova]|uniref:Clp1 P-loop domain-containing protein n=1 Tax=Oppiella nova TaxID=334625 RepID=A0A7R9LWE1_9ACAR|nr:unnamed protein product [Oppiella nova]CAG2167548.1 unnamed protein product [Oppiella nova]